MRLKGLASGLDSRETGPSRYRLREPAGAFGGEVQPGRFLRTRLGSAAARPGYFLFEFAPLLFEIVNLHLIELLKLAKSCELIIRCFVRLGCC